jgi:hypothetical protein
MLRAAFVPDGEQPPAEFLTDFSPLKFRATLDRATGIITCDNAGAVANREPGEAERQYVYANAGNDPQRPSGTNTGGAVAATPQGKGSGGKGSFTQAQATEPEVDNRSPVEELLDPLASVRVRSRSTQRSCTGSGTSRLTRCGVRRCNPKGLPGGA